MQDEWDVMQSGFVPWVELKWLVRVGLAHLIRLEAGCGRHCVVRFVMLGRHMLLAR